MRDIRISLRGKLVSFVDDPIESELNKRTVRLWNLAIEAAHTTLAGSSSYWARFIAFSPNRKQIAFISDDQTIRLWDSATRVARATFMGHSGHITAIAFSPDGKQIVSASDDETIRLWDLSMGRTAL